MKLYITAAATRKIEILAWLDKDNTLSLTHLAILGDWIAELESTGVRRGKSWLRQRREASFLLSLVTTIERTETTPLKIFAACHKLFADIQTKAVLKDPSFVKQAVTHGLISLDERDVRELIYLN